jgi:hypothetical protein
MGLTRRSLLGSSIAGLAALTTKSHAESKYDTGASDTDAALYRRTLGAVRAGDQRRGRRYLT